MNNGPNKFISHIFEALSRRDEFPLVLFLDRGESIGEKLTGRQLRNRALQWAAALENQVPAAHAVLLVMPPGSDFLTALLGCLFAGVVAVPLPVPRPGAHGGRLDAVIADSQAAAILCTSDSARSLHRHFGHPGTSHPPVIVLDGAALPAREPLCAGFARPDDAPVIIQYTSGSTRQPRGVALGGINILGNSRLVAERWRQDENGISVNWLPHYHDMGLMGGILYPLLWGARSVQMSPLAFVQKPIRWLRAIAAHRGSLSGGPSFAFGLCLDAISGEDMAGLDLSCWKVAFCGAEPVPSTLLQRFRERFGKAGLDPAAVHACYGLAEATLLVAGQRDWSSPPVVPPAGAAGTEPCRLSPGTRETLRIVDAETRRPVADGREGEIWVSSPSVAGGYVNHPGCTAEIFAARLEGEPGRYLRTGDLGLIGPDGLHITGRLKDILIADGVNVAAVDIEWLAAEHHPALNPLAAAAFPLEQLANSGAALLIEFKTARAAIDDPRIIADRIRAAVRAAHGIDLNSVHFVKRGSLERTTSGKIKRQAVAARFRAGHLYPGSQS